MEFEYPLPFLRHSPLAPYIDRVKIFFTLITLSVTETLQIFLGVAQFEYRPGTHTS